MAIYKPVYLDIRDTPTSINVLEPGKLSESLFRSYRILNEVKQLLELGTPGVVVLELIKLMEYQEKDKPADKKQTAGNS